MLRIRLCAPRLNLIHLARQEQFHYTVLDYGLSTTEARNSMTTRLSSNTPVMREITTSCTLIAVCIKIYQSDLLISSGMVIIVYSSLLLINYLLNSYNNRINYMSYDSIE